MTLREQLEQFRDFIAEQHPGDGSRKLYYLGDLDLVLREGREFENVPWKTWRGSGYRHGKARECFMNAHHLALRHPELAYVEGFASKGFLQIHHAWNATEDGRIVDPTWRDDWPDYPAEGWEYLGVPFELRFVDEVTFAKKTYGVLDDFKIYEQPLPEGAVRKLTGRAILARDEKEGGIGMTTAQIAGKMTPHQRWALRMLRRAGAAPYERWVSASDCGAPAAMERFAARGLVERKVELGPRGGEHVYYRPTDAGDDVADYILYHGLKTY